MEVNILERSTGIKRMAVIEPMTESDYLIVSESGQFEHDWHKYTKGYDNFKVFKIRISETNKILGIMSTNYSIVVECPYEIEHIELTKENQGKNKKYGYVAGCLIAYACMESKNLIDKKFDFLDGTIVIQAKNDILRQHYCSTYNMIDLYGDIVQSSVDNGKCLIKKYLNLNN